MSRFPPKLFLQSLLALAPDKDKVEARVTEIICNHPEHAYWLGYFAALIIEFPGRLVEIEKLFNAPARQRAAMAKKFFCTEGT